MKMKIHVCDLCKKSEPDAKIEYKYRAEQRWMFWGGYKWERMELCRGCLNKIIQARSEDK